MSELKDNLLNIKQEKDTKILPENIKKGITIYNITGTLEEGGSSNIIKQFDSIANMQADPSPVEGGLASVYYNSQAGITADTEFQVATFPETVILDTALTDYIDVQFQAIDTSIMFDCYGNLESSSFSMSCYTDSGEISIQYESSDGVTYTRNTFRKNGNNIEGTEMDFDTIIKFGSRWGSSEFNPILGNFILVGSSAYSGLYKYNTEDNRYNLAPTSLNATTETVYTGSFYGKNGIEEGQLSVTNNLNAQQLKNRVNLYSNLSYLGLNENVTSISNLFNGCSNIKCISNINTKGIFDMSNLFNGCSNLTTIPNFNTSNVTNMALMFSYCYNLTTIPNFDTSNVTDMLSTFYQCSNLIDIPEFNTSNVINMPQTFFGCINLSSNSIQNVVNMIPSANKVHLSTIGQIYPYITKLNSNQKDTLFNKGYLDCDQNTTGWSTQYNYYNGTTWLTINRDNNYDRYGTTLKSKVNYFTNNSALRDVQIKSIGIDNGILLYLNGVFSGQYSKLTVVNSFNIMLNTSNVITTDRMFYGCSNLSTVSNFDTKNVRYASSMFYECYNLKTVPSFDFSNVIRAQSMFRFCYNLTDVKIYNINNIINTSEMFYSCRNLVNVPNINSNNITEAQSMFYRL